MTRALLLLSFLSVSASAQLPTKDPTVKGIIYINVDDTAAIFINGVLAYRSTGPGKSKSEEIGLKPGDRVVVQLRNIALPKCFLMAFASSDRTQVVSFARQSFKVLADSESTDFAAADLPRLGKYPKPQRYKPEGVFPFKHKSDYFWAEADDCALGCIVTQQMFSPMRFL